MDKLAGKRVVVKLHGERKAIEDPWQRRALSDLSPPGDFIQDVTHELWLYVDRVSVCMCVRACVCACVCVRVCVCVDWFKSNRNDSAYRPMITNNRQATAAKQLVARCQFHAKVVLRLTS